MKTTVVKALLPLISLLVVLVESSSTQASSGHSPSLMLRSKQSNEKNRLLQSASLRVFLEFVRSDSLYQPTNANFQKYLYSKQTIIRVAAYYSAFLKVRTRRDRNEFSTFTAVDGYSQPGRNFEGDLFIYFNALTSGSSWASYNLGGFDSVTSRCIAASFIGNLNMFSVTPQGAQRLYTFYRREFFRILAFDTTNFANFVNPSNNVKLGIAATMQDVNFNGVNRRGYFGSNALNWAKTYTGDGGSLTYVLLEDQGGNGNFNVNWEGAYWPQELMTADDSTYPRSFSGLSMNVALDSGWYEIDSGFEETMFTGRGNNAQVLQNNPCSTARDGFCSSGASGNAGCSTDLTSKNRCSTDQFSNGCFAMRNYLNCAVSSTDYGTDADTSFENIGKANARCGIFRVGTGGNLLPRCAVMACDTTNGGATAANPSVVYTFANATICTCTGTNQGTSIPCTNVAAGGSMNVQCPSSGGNYQNLCTALSSTGLLCPNDCSGRGTCSGPSGGRKCSCTYGWMGTDCNTANPAEGTMTNPIGITTMDFSGNLLTLSSILFGLLMGTFQA